MRATDRLITVGGSPGVRGSRQRILLFPEGQQIPTPETAETVRSEEEFKFGYLARISEGVCLTIMKAGITRRHIFATR